MQSRPSAPSRTHHGRGGARLRLALAMRLPVLAARRGMRRLRRRWRRLRRWRLQRRRQRCGRLAVSVDALDDADGTCRDHRVARVGRQDRRDDQRHRHTSTTQPGQGEGQRRIAGHLRGDVRRSTRTPSATRPRCPTSSSTSDTTTQFMIDSRRAVPASACLAADPDAQATYDEFLPAVTAAYTVQDILWPVAFNVSEPVLYVEQRPLRSSRPRAPTRCRRTWTNCVPPPRRSRPRTSRE